MKESVQTDHAPQAIGPYSQAIVCAGYAYISGQIPLDPATGRLVSDDFDSQVDQVLTNLEAVASACGASLDSVLQLTVYIVDMDHFKIVNHYLGQYFNEPYPARAVVGVSQLPKGAQIEMAAMATVGGNQA